MMRWWLMVSWWDEKEEELIYSVLSSIIDHLIHHYHLIYHLTHHLIISSSTISSSTMLSHPPSHHPPSHLPSHPWRHQTIVQFEYQYMSQNQSEMLDEWDGKLWDEMVKIWYDLPSHLSPFHLSHHLPSSKTWDQPCRIMSQPGKIQTNLLSKIIFNLIYIYYWRWRRWDLICLTIYHLISSTISSTIISHLMVGSKVVMYNLTISSEVNLLFIMIMTW